LPATEQIFKMNRTK